MMTVLAGDLGLALAALAAATMGFAIQRGATCSVAAVKQIIAHRSSQQLMAMLEAALWVAVGLTVAQRLHWLAELPHGFAISGWTVLGAVILGLGAFINQACVFGAIARLGSGQWAYLATPIGYFVGCLSANQIYGSLVIHKSVASSSLMLNVGSFVIWPLVALMAWRLFRIFVTHTRALHWPQLRNTVWSAHGATLVIGFTFFATMLLVKTWAYTDVLAEIARGMTTHLSAGTLLSVALLLGALLGGWTAGRLRWTRVHITTVLRCFTGGVLMAWGSLMIPGSNDGLILIGMGLKIFIEHMFFGGGVT
jgi:toxin CptA